MNAKHHLLIVDENPYVVDILTETLRKDFIVTVANSGQEAARLLIQGNRFDCVLTELNLPFFNGLELTKLIRMSKLIATMPVVILSNAPDSDTRIKCLEQGVDNFILKPFNPLEVKAKLLALLRWTGAAAVDENQKRSTMAPVAERGKLAWQPKSRILAMLLGTSYLPQST